MDDKSIKKSSINNQSKDAYKRPFCQVINFNYLDVILASTACPENICPEHTCDPVWP